jgi:hypothetical protein
MYVSLGVDRNGQPQVTYCDPRAGRLRLARRINDQWVVETFDADGNLGGFGSLAVDRFGVAHVAYYDWEARIPRVAVSDKGPRLAGDQLKTFVNRAVRKNLLANDRQPDNNPLVMATTPVGTPAHGTVTLAADGAVTYTPKEDFAGDAFRYEAADASGISATADVTITVTVPVLAQAANRLLTPNTIRAPRLDFLAVESSERQASDIQAGRMNANTFVPVGLRAAAADFPLPPLLADSGPGPFIIAFIARQKGYILAFSAPFVFPPQPPQDVVFTGSLVDSEGPLRTV